MAVTIGGGRYLLLGMISNQQVAPAWTTMDIFSKQVATEGQEWTKQALSSSSMISRAYLIISGHETIGYLGEEGGRDFLKKKKFWPGGRLL